MIPMTTSIAIRCRKLGWMINRVDRGIIGKMIIQNAQPIVCLNEFLMTERKAEWKNIQNRMYGSKPL